jgi:aminoglycoside phosphotransferase (APT) family kinase protein
VRTWGRQLAASHSRDVPELEELGRRLAVAPPATTRPAIVHGDYRLDNVLVDLSGGAGPSGGGPGTGVPRITAVLDWEMATLGDALADVAMTLVWYDGLAGLDSPVAVVPGEVATFPTGPALLARYAARTGADLSELPWQLALAHYKIGAIFEGIHYRYVAGQTVGDGFDRIGALVGPVAERGLAVLTDH